MRGTERHFKTHLTIMAALVAIPFVVASGLVAARYVATEIERTERQALGAAKDISSAIDMVLREGLTALRTLSLSNAAKTGNFEVMYQQAEQVAQFLPGTVIAVRNALDGQQVLNTALPWGSLLPRTSDPTLLSADRLAVEKNGPVISDLYRGAATGKDFIIIELPFKIGEATFLLNLAVPPEVVRKVVEHSSSAKSFWLVSILDKQHRIIARTREHDQYVGKTATKTFTDNVAGDEGTFYSTTLDGTNVFDAYAKSDLSGFVTVAAIPTADFNAPIRQAIILAVAALAVGLIFAVFLSSLYSKYITPCVHRLRKEATRLGQRQPVKAFKTGIIELTEVSAALEDAAAALDRDEKAKAILIDEMNHRVKNSLVTVQSLAQQTMRRAATPAEFEAAFTGRLMALSQTHNALSQSDWVSVDFVDLCKSVCAVDDRWSFKGPAVRIRPRAALTMGMVLHELCTNASRHGALAAPGGHIEVTWHVDEGVFHFVWREETSGPVQPPGNQGFGMKYVKNSIEHELKGVVSFDFQPRGLSVTGSFRNDEAQRGMISLGQQI